MAIPSAEALRLLNLAYRKMQEDFAVFAEELFRANEALTTDASGYLLLPTYVTEVEDIRWTNSVHRKLKKINKDFRHTHTGYYHDGIDTSSNKRRLMVRDGGNTPTTGTSFNVHYLREFSDLANESDPPIPFVGKRYLDMLTTLQAYYYYTEQGKEKAKDAEQKLKEYKMMLDAARKDFFDDEPDYGTSNHPDAGYGGIERQFHPSNA